MPCCTDDGQFLEESDLSHGKCIPIEIPQADPFYSMFRQRCMQFARSAPACRTDGRLGHVEQVSRVYLNCFFLFCFVLFFSAIGHVVKVMGDIK